MSRTISARYDKGVFIPLEKVSLPEHAVIRLVIPDAPGREPRKQLKGMLAGMGIDVNEQDIRDLRSEMWEEIPTGNLVTDGLLLDTHAIIWYLGQPDKLSQRAADAIDAAYSAEAPLYVSAISLIEIIYLGEKRRISEEAARAVIEALTSGNGFVVIPVDEAVAGALAGIPRNAAPDMPDRIIAATGSMLSVSIVTKDHLITSSGVPTIW